MREQALAAVPWAAAVDLDVIGVTVFHNYGVARISSEGYDAFEISLNNLEIHSGETGTSAIVRGILSKFSSKSVGSFIGKLSSKSLFVKNSSQTGNSPCNYDRIGYSR